MVNEQTAIFSFLNEDVIFANTLIITSIFAGIIFIFELIHLWRTHKHSTLIWGLNTQMALTMYIYALLRIIGLPLFLWGALILFAPFMRYEPKSNETADQVDKNESHHWVFLLDVSPSMLFPVDGGPEKNLKRIKRVEQVYKSVISRIDRAHGLYSVIAFWNDAKVIVADTKDINILDNIFNDLPLAYAMKNSGEQTALVKAISVVSKLGKDWLPKSATLVVLTDGDVLPETGLTKLPDAFSKVLVLGIGDASKGALVGTHYSKQNYGSLTDLASRYGGIYINANEKMPETNFLKKITSRKKQYFQNDYNLRDYAILACAIGGTIFAFSTVFMFLFTSSWRRKVKKRS